MQRNITIGVISGGILFLLLAFIASDFNIYIYHFFILIIGCITGGLTSLMATIILGLIERYYLNDQHLNSYFVAGIAFVSGFLSGTLVLFWYLLPHYYAVIIPATVIGFTYSIIIGILHKLHIFN